MIDFVHAEALEMDAEFNFEDVSREINTGNLPPSSNEGAYLLIMRAVTGCHVTFAGCVTEGELLVERLTSCGYHSVATDVDNLVTGIVGQLRGISLETQRRRLINGLASLAAAL